MHISATQHLNTFDNILCLNDYPENSIEHKTPTKAQRNPQPANTGWSHLKILYISERLNHKITNIFTKENIPVHIAHISYMLRPALSHTPRSTNALERNALSLTLDCVYDKMQYTSSCVTAAINNTLVAQHTLSTTTKKNISITKTHL